MTVTVGSEALKFYDMNRREPKDIDVWVGVEMGKEPGFDIVQMPEHIFKYFTSYYATPNQVYTIKCSHLAWDVHWEKTKNDILWLEAKGCELIPDLYNDLKKVWEEEHGDKSFLSLNKNKDDFFTDGVKYVYDHDYLHELVAYPDLPVYSHCLKDNEAVLVDKQKFDCMDFDMQVRMFREEITVIAVERWLLHNPQMSWYEAYGLSLKKTITNLTKNWASDFLILNLKHFVKPEYEYFDHILKTLKLENSMSKVDLTVFEELQEKFGTASLSDLVYYLASDEAGEAISSDVVGYEEFRDGTGKLNWNAYRARIDKLLDEVGYEHLDQEGGGEGGSEYCYGVFKLQGKIYKAEYSYHSYSGHEYYGIVDTLREVEPKQKTITVYE